MWVVSFSKDLEGFTHFDPRPEVRRGREDGHRKEDVGTFFYPLVLSCGRDKYHRRHLQSQSGSPLPDKFRIQTFRTPVSVDSSQSRSVPVSVFISLPAPLPNCLSESVGKRGRHVHYICITDIKSSPKKRHIQNSNNKITPLYVTRTIWGKCLSLFIYEGCFV